jgi:hypothetical protein
MGSIWNKGYAIVTKNNGVLFLSQREGVILLYISVGEGDFRKHGMCACVYQQITLCIRAILVLWEIISSTS